jgi:hypothetical protein
MLTIFQLQHLPLNEQAQYVWDNGEFAVTKHGKGYSTNLYWLGSFYAEVICNEKTNAIVELVFKEANINDYL